MEKGECWGGVGEGVFNSVKQSVVSKERGRIISELSRSNCCFG